MSEAHAMLIQTALGLVSSGNGQAAVMMLEESVRQDPESFELLRALAEAHLGCGDLEAAKQRCQQSITIDPAFARAWFLLGVICAHAGELDESMAALEQAIKLRLDYYDAVRALAAVAGRSGHLSRGLECFRQLVDVGIDGSDILLEYAETAEQHGATEEAITVRKILLDREPDNLENRFNLASLTGANPPAIAPATLVTKTFDTYAERFEAHLDQLGYDGPDRLWEAVTRQHLGTDLQVLDLGCGTGLCGKRFQRIAGGLVGVDLSKGMLQKASEKQIYDELVCCDALEFLADSEKGYDLVIAADFLVYVGDLEPLFSAIRNRINVGGRFAFTIECGDEQDIVVSRSHRYQHRPTYVRDTLRQSRWQILEFEECVLRKEYHRAVAGLVVVAEPMV